MQVPLSGSDITQKEKDAVLAVLNSPYLSLGPKLPQFERLVAEYTGVKYAVAVNSGTSALHLIIRSLGIKDGDEVITTPFSFIASSNAILFERAKPVFVDIDPQAFNLAPSLIENKITKKTRAILAVDVFGYPAPWEELERIAHKHHLYLIEDSCEALGAHYKGRHAGSFGDAGCFAFYPNKQITTGEGGVIVTNNEIVAKLSKSMRNQGRGEEGAWLQHQRLGYNYRLSDINCALGIVQMERLTEIMYKRQQVAQWYGEILADVEGITLPPNSSSDILRSWFVYVVKLGEKYSRDDRDEILGCLREKGIGCSNYFTPIHLQPFYVEMFKCKPGDFPVTEEVSARTIALPFSSTITRDAVGYVTDNFKNIIKKHKK